MVGTGRRRWLWLGMGAALALFAVDGRWDIPLAAWLVAVFLLRFARTSRPVVGLPLVWLVSAGAALWWMWQLAVPLTPLVLVGALAFGTVLALPYLADRPLTPRLGPVGGLLPFPLALAGCEFLLGAFGPFGTAYGLLADTQHDDLALVQSIALVGPYGIAFLIGGVATVVNWAWVRPLSWRVVRLVGAYAAVLAIVVVAGAVRLALFPVDTAQTVRIAGINPSRSVASAAVIDGLFADTRQAAAAGAKIVVWSENAARVSTASEPALLAEAAAVARQEHIYLDIADNVHLPTPPYGRDETHLIGPDGTLLWTYEKAHPIPGLETYTPGDGVVPVVSTPYGRIANVICYDADFPALMHVDADIMLVPGGDWPQMGRVHTDMASLRAIENGYSLVRQDFDGWSAAFDDQGHPLSTQDTTGDARVWLVDVPIHGTATPYRVIGDVFGWLCLAGLAVLSGLAVARRKVKSVDVTGAGGR